MRKLQPHILINNRGFDEGDFATPERSVPDGDRFPTMTEACQSVGEHSWGYREEEDYFSASHLMQSVDKIMAMGGSYLLNVGPMADGTLPAQSVRLLRRIGSWYTRTKEALENTAPAARSYALSGGVPHIAVEKNGVTYFHFYRGLNSSAVTFLDDDIPTPRRAVLLNSGAELPIRRGTLPSKVDADAVARKEYYSIREIPVDDYPAEPLVIAVEWE